MNSRLEGAEARVAGALNRLGGRIVVFDTVCFGAENTWLGLNKPGRAVAVSGVSAEGRNWVVGVDEVNRRNTAGVRDDTRRSSDREDRVHGESSRTRERQCD